MNFAAFVVWPYFVCLAAFIILMTPSLLAGVPWVPARARAVEAMIALARPAPGELWVDLGSGDGRILIAAARAGARAVGYEVNPFLVFYSRLAIRLQGMSGRADVRWTSYWPADLSEADVVSLYASVPLMPRLQDKLRAGLKPGARVVSLVFRFPDWKPEKTDARLFLYRKT